MFAFPFSEEKRGNVVVRRFSAEVDDEELVWHRDREDREVTVLEGAGWYFQMDDQLPVQMKSGDVYNIPRETWHRVIRRGSSDLVVRVAFLSL